MFTLLKATDSCTLPEETLEIASPFPVPVKLLSDATIERLPHKQKMIDPDTSLSDALLYAFGEEVPNGDQKIGAHILE